MKNEKRSDFEELVPGLIVIAAEDFHRAFEAASRKHEGSREIIHPVDAMTGTSAARIAGIANAPGTLGLTATIHADRTPQQFSGNIFALARNPVFEDGVRRVVVTEYDIVAIELTGVATWLGRDARFEIDLEGTSKSGRCCGPETICVPVQPDPEGPILHDSERVAVAPEARGYPSRSNDGSPSVTLFSYGGSFGGIDPDPRGGFGGRVPVPTPMDCTMVHDRGCGIAKPMCDPGDAGFTPNDDGSADIPVGSNPCGRGFSWPAHGRDVPEICQQITIAETIEEKCFGWHGSFEEPWAANNYRPKFCNVARALPGSICAPDASSDPVIRNAMLQLQAGWIPGQEAHHCESTGQGRGIEQCVDCDSTGNCNERLVVPKIDPALVVVGDVCKRGDGSSCDSSSATDDLKAAGKAIADFFKAVGSAIASAATAIGSAIASLFSSSSSPTSTTSSRTSPGGPDSGGGNPNPPSTAPRPPFQGGTQSTNLVNRSTRAGDPVELGDGALYVEHVDLSFGGPVRRFEFRKIYRSTSRERSSMGSNWSHNWDVWLEPLTEDTIPPWLSPWCAGAPGLTTAVLLHNSDGSADLFLLDISTQVYLPHAGTTDTLAQTVSGGWARRSPDGRILEFDSDGYLIRDRDRFGNGFTVTYEPTPLGRLFNYYCARAQLTARNETLASRRNALLAWLVGAAPRPPFDPGGWTVSAGDFPPPADPVLAAELAYARDYLIYLAGFQSCPDSIDGRRKKRATRVTDDVQRTLDFEYFTATGYAANPGPPAFAASPHAGLLSKVSGPAGTSVAFEYARPQGYPTALNESFLVHSIRHDTLTGAGIRPAPDREYRFSYQWPGGLTESYDKYAAVVQTRYLDYFSTFVGCRYDEVLMCGDGKKHLNGPKIAAGNPAALAAMASDTYVSDVADNLILITMNGQVEVESRYPADPFDLQFDRVVTQRSGSSYAVAPPLPPTTDAPGDNWTTALPKSVLEYVEAGPDGWSDGTDRFLPQAIRDRYPLEVIPPSDGSTPIPPVSGHGGPNSCDFAAMEDFRRKLPGYRATIPYFDVPPPQRQRPGTVATIRLLRTPLTRSQLIAAQVGDPTHNDNISTLNANPANPFQPFVVRVAGRRQAIAANANRICGWVRRIDRDGVTHYSGINYRGQLLVDAVDEGAPRGFVFTEWIYNADGMVVEDRRPTASSSPWQFSDGRTLYHYDDIDPTGNRGWNGWLPAFWARRKNLLRIEIQAPAGSVVDDTESGTFVNSFGRYHSFVYEPLFNQLLSNVEGSVEQKSAGLGRGTTYVDVPQRRTDRVFDYQELSAAVPDNDPISIWPVLEQLQPWGFHWLRNNANAFAAQLPVALLGMDVNGDESFGNRFATTNADRALGAVVAIVESRPGASNSEQGWLFSWTPHGQLGRIDGPDGEVIVHEYYPSDPAQLPGPFGSGNAPAAGQSDVGFTGMLAKISRRIARPNYPETGPPEPPNEDLSGPYQWLLARGEPLAALNALGLPQEMVDDIVATIGAQPTDGSSAVSYAYNVAGYVTSTRTAAGVTTAVTDPDGRSMVTTDPTGVRAEVDFDAFGNAITERRFDAVGTQCGQTQRTFDEEGRLLTECRATVPNGCNSGFPDESANFSNQYWPEGKLFQSVDPEGLRSRYFYDTRGRVTRIESSGNVAAAGTGRILINGYDVDGLRISSKWTSSSGNESLSESITYDGLGRIRNLTDRRGIQWQYAWSRRDLGTGLRRTDEPYGQPVASTPIWEVRRFYDDHGGFSRETTSGIVTGRYSRTAAGAITSFSSDGRGVQWRVYDLLGRLVWSRDADGTQSVITRREMPARVWNAAIRLPINGPGETIATKSSLDANGRTVGVTRVATGLAISRTWVRDAMGLPIRMDGPLDDSIITERNWLGWPIRVTRQPRNGRRSSTTYAYNRRGALRLTADPEGQRLELDYNDFGEISQRRLSGQPPVTESWSRDGLGRIERHRMGALVVRNTYDVRGDLGLVELEELGTWQTVASYTFDDLARPTHILNTNYGLSWLAEADRSVKTELTYDDLGRVKATEISVGNLPAVSTANNWSLTANNTWQRDAGAQLGGWSMGWRETLDSATRMSTRARLTSNGFAPATTFLWMGDRYAGRRQPQPGWDSRFRETIEFDAFGLPSRTTFRAIELDAAGLPLDPVEGADYCAGAWDVAECSSPLLESRIVRDSIGRAGIRNWRHGHPVVIGNNRVAGLPGRWRGYAYTPHRQLERVWEDDARPWPPAPTPANYAVDEIDVEAAAPPANEWEYSRLVIGGDTNSINAIPAGTPRWRLSTPRAPGHQLTGVDIEGIGVLLTHNPVGQVATAGDLGFSWHPGGSLAVVTRNNLMIEGYAYDGLGRLAAIFANTATATPEMRLVNHGLQTVSALDGLGKPMWEAAWGPLLDQLLEWNEIAQGSGLHIPLVDEQSSVLGLWNPASARVEATMNYTPEGRVHIRDRADQSLCREGGPSDVCAGPLGMPFGFVGAFRSVRTGILWLRNRWYSPALGQFLTQDPLGFVDGTNLYAYAASDPVNRTDPLGLGSQGPAKAGTGTPGDLSPVLSPDEPGPSFPPWFTPDQKKAYIDRHTTIGTFNSWANRDPVTGRLNPPRDPYTPGERALFAFTDFLKSAFLVVVTLPVTWEWLGPEIVAGGLGPGESFAAASVTAEESLAATLGRLESEGVNMQRAAWTHVGPGDTGYAAVVNRGGAYVQNGRIYANMDVIGGGVRDPNLGTVLEPRQVLQHEVGHLGQPAMASGDVTGSAIWDAEYYQREAEASLNAAAQATNAADKAALTTHGATALEHAMRFLNSSFLP